MATTSNESVTFLMTDVEGSTARWEQHPREMRQALARHDEIMMAGVEKDGGKVVKGRGEGDSVFAVFPDPINAVAAAVDLQRSLFTEPWQLPEPLRVRMALHTGETEFRDGDYYGPAVNRCARLRAIAHGGQTLASAATSALVGGSLPTGVTLRDLGRHRLRDLSQPELVTELVHPDLPATFPPLRSLNTHAHNLPVQTTPFVGRERELREVKMLIVDEGVRLLTLTGPGGIGKTRLSLQVAADLVETFYDGVFVVDLSVVGDPDLVPSVIAQTFGIQAIPGWSLLETLTEFFPGRHMLMILDNFEQLLAAASVVAALHSVCPKLHILVNSRAVLHLSGERVYPLAPLQAPDEVPDSGASPMVGHVRSFDAVQLFEVRARAVKPDFSVTPENVAAVVTICRLVDGVPLAIELAAARIRMLPPQAIARRLIDALPLLTGGARDVPERQRTLRGAISWSYKLLPEPEQVLFRRLSVFAGGSALETAGIVAGNEFGIGSGIDVLDGVGALIDASLIEQEESTDGEPRFRMLRVMRAFGLEQLAECGEAHTVQQRHADYFLGLAEAAEPHLHGARQQEWHERLLLEYDNLRAALVWFRDHGGDEQYLQMVGALFWFWIGKGDRTEALEWNRDALSRVPERTPARVRALYGAGLLSHLAADNAGAQHWLEEGISIARELDIRNLEARLMHPLSLIADSKGNHVRARETLEAALAIARNTGDNLTIGFLLDALASAVWRAGDVQKANKYIEESVLIHRRSDARWALALALNTWGDLLRAEERYDDAERRYEESLQLVLNLSTRDGEQSIRHNLGWVAIGQGYPALAMSRFHEALKLMRGIGDLRGIAECIVGIASATDLLGDPEEAARLFGVAQAIFERSGIHASVSNTADHERALQRIKQSIGEQAFDAARASGLAADSDETVEAILRTWTASAI